MSNIETIHEDLKANERDGNVSIYQGQQLSTTKRQMQICEDVERVTITFSDLYVVQVGKSDALKNDVEPCCNHRQNKRKQLKTKEYERLKEESIPDKAAGVTELDSAFSTKILSSAEIGFTTLSAEDNGGNTREEVRHHERIKEILDVEYCMLLIERKASITGFKCEIVMKRLEKLQDNGQFDEHEKCACAILESCSTREDPDMWATLMIERGMAFYYTNDLRKCKQLFDAAIRMGESLVNRSLLEARALFLKSEAYRRENKYNKALQCLKRAELLLFHHESGEDKGELYYNYGSFWLHLHSTKSSNNLQGREVFREKAKKCFEKAIEHGARDNRLRVQLKQKRYYNLRIATLYLDCSSKAARKTQQVRIEDVEEAKKRLDFVECQLGDGMPLGTRVQLLKIRSDQHYRQGNVRLAKEVAKEGLEIAMKLEKNSSAGPLRERLEELQAMEDAWPPQNIESVFGCMSDSGLSGDCSSD